MNVTEAFNANHVGICCPVCNDPTSKVIETSSWQGYNLRVRLCASKGHRFYTMEMEGHDAFKLYQEYNAKWNQSRRHKDAPVSPVKRPEQPTSKGLMTVFGRQK